MYDSISDDTDARCLDACFLASLIRALSMLRLGFSFVTPVFGRPGWLVFFLALTGWSVAHGRQVGDHLGGLDLVMDLPD